MDVLKSLLEFAVCAAVIVVAGTVLTKCADTIAEVTKLGRLLVGSVLLAGATSLPELTVDISAIRLGAPDLAIGDLLGSSLANLLILAVLDLTHHSRGQMLSRQAARHALSGSMSVALTALAGLSLLTGPMLGSFTNSSIRRSRCFEPYILGGLGPLEGELHAAGDLAHHVAYLVTSRSFGHHLSPPK